MKIKKKYKEKKMKKTSESSPDEIQLKIMLLGNTAVGKTSFILKYTENTFQEVHLSTIGVDFRVKTITYENKNYKLSIYDTTGQERYKSLAFSLIKNVDGIILMYDVTDESTFKSVPNWIQSARDKKGENYPIILLGNKIDLADRRKVTTEEGEEIAAKNGLDFFEISNKESVNIENAILTLVKKIIINIEKNGKKENSNLILTSQALKKKDKKCC